MYPKVPERYKYHFVREKLSDRTTKLRYYPTNDLLTTKGLTDDKFSKLRNLTGMKEMIV